MTPTIRASDAQVLRRLLARAHPFPDALGGSAAAIKAFCVEQQRRDFSGALSALGETGDEVLAALPRLAGHLAAHPDPGLVNRLGRQALLGLFERMHAHVMDHPVWTHPFFKRVARGDVTAAQLQRFAVLYFGQVKNTRQCVALALGRFYSLAPAAAAPRAALLSEATQLILAGLLADEYGFARGAGVTTDASPLRAALSPATHTELYRRFLDGLGVPREQHDRPLLAAVADNVIIQRALAGDAEFTPVEALASVGLGMEWGVPVFFSMIIAGLAQLAARGEIPAEPETWEIWTAHVRQDVEHAIATLLAAALHCEGPADEARMMQATTTLMSFRYEMMSAIHRAVLDEECAGFGPVSANYRCVDPRIGEALLRGRLATAPEAVAIGAAYAAAPQPAFLDPARRVA